MRIVNHDAVPYSLATLVFETMGTVTTNFAVGYAYFTDTAAVPEEINDYFDFYGITQSVQDVSPNVSSLVMPASSTKYIVLNIFADPGSTIGDNLKVDTTTLTFDESPVIDNNALPGRIITIV